MSAGSSGSACSLSFGYIGMVLAMRSNKEDFSLIIPYVRFSPQNKPDNLLLLDTSVIIDGRIADLIEAQFIEGLVVVPRFVLLELQQIADSADDIKRARGRRGFEMLNRLQHNTKIEVRIHDGDFPEEKGVDAKLVRLARNLNAKLFTNDSNLAKVAGLQSVSCVNLHEIGHLMKAAMIPGETVQLKIVREGRDKGPGHRLSARRHDGHRQQRPAPRRPGRRAPRCISTVQTGAGVIVFAEIRNRNRQMNPATIFNALQSRPKPNWSARGWKRRAFIRLSPTKLAALSIDGYALAAGGIRVQVPESEAADATEFLDLARRMNFRRQLRQLKKLLPGEIFLQPATLAKYAGDKWFATHQPDAVALPRSDQIRFQDFAVRAPAQNSRHAARRGPRLRRRLRADARRHRALDRAHGKNSGDQRQGFCRRRPARREHRRISSRRRKARSLLSARSREPRQ